MTADVDDIVCYFCCGEGGSGQREVEDEGDDSGIILVEALLSMGLRDKLGLLEGGKVSGMEV